MNTTTPTWRAGQRVTYVGLTGTNNLPGRIVRVLKSGPIVQFDSGLRDQVHPRDIEAI